VGQIQYALRGTHAGGAGPITYYAPSSPCMDQPSQHGHVGLTPEHNDEIVLEHNDFGYSDNKMGSTSEEEEDGEDIRFSYRPETWSKLYASYDLVPMPFTGESYGLTQQYESIPLYVELFRKFWSHETLKRICRETNRYSSSLDKNGVLRGKGGWYPITEKELKVFMAVILYMGMKKLPNMKAYWAKSEEFFYCNVIAGLFMRKRFLALLRCLHVTDPATYVEDRSSPAFNKMHQTQWLINEMKASCKREWHLGQHVTVDETMVRYKGKYALARQYMPKKPIKWGFKVWILADATSHIIFDFEVYCGRSTVTLEGGMSQGVEQNLAHRVVTNLTSGLDNKGHVITMDNFFTSVGLFRGLERRGIYATRTMRSNRIGLHLDMRNIREFRRRGQGDLDWFMHNSRRMGSVLWKDRMPVLLLSTHAPPITPGNPRDCTVPRRDGALRLDIPTSPMLQEYTKNMRGIDVADHIRGNYTC
jgi:hypothetical protein